MHIFFKRFKNKKKIKAWDTVITENQFIQFDYWTLIVFSSLSFCFFCFLVKCDFKGVDATKILHWKEFQAVNSIICCLCKFSLSLYYYTRTYKCVYKLLLLFFKVNNDQNKEFELFWSRHLGCVQPEISFCWNWAERWSWHQ